MRKPQFIPLVCIVYYFICLIRLYTVRILYPHTNNINTCSLLINQLISPDILGEFVVNYYY